MDPQSFILGLMAGITLLGGGILLAMIILEQPRPRLRRWQKLASIPGRRWRVWLERLWVGAPNSAPNSAARRSCAQDGLAKGGLANEPRDRRRGPRP